MASRAMETKLDMGSRNFKVPNNVMLSFRDPFKISPASDLSSKFNAEKLISSVDEGSLQLELRHAVFKFIEGRFARQWCCQVLDRKHSKGSVPNSRKVVIFSLCSPCLVRLTLVNQIFHI